MKPMSAAGSLTTGCGIARGVSWPQCLGAMLAGVLLLSACGGSPEGDAEDEPHEPSESASARNATSDDDGGSDSDRAGKPVPASSEGPAENWPTPEPDNTVSQKDIEGAEAALEHSFELLQYDDLTGDSGPYLEMSAESCDTCVENTKRAEVIYEAGGWFLGVEYRMASADLALPTPGRAQGSFTVDTAPFSIVDSSGEKHDYESRTVRGVVSLSYADNEWTIDSLSYTDDGSSD